MIRMNTLLAGGGELRAETEGGDTLLRLPAAAPDPPDLRQK